MNAKNVPGPILHSFYSLSNVNAKNRQQAVRNLVRGLTSHSESWKYVLHRLVVGLGSSNACARQGFSCGLVICLRMICHEKFKSKNEVVVQFVEEIKKLDLSGQDAQNNVLGRLLAVLCLLKSDCCDVRDESELTLLVQVLSEVKQTNLLRPHSEQLFFSAVLTIARQTPHRKQFESCFESMMFNDLKNDWTLCTPNQLWLLLSLHGCFPKLIKKHFSMIKLDGRSGLMGDVSSKNGVKSVIVEACNSSPVLHPVVPAIIDCVFSSSIEEIDVFSSEIIQKQLLTSSDRRLVTFAFEVLEETIKKCMLVEYVEILLSKPCWMLILQACLGHKSQRFVHGSIQHFFNALHEWGASRKDSPDLVLTVLRNIYSVVPNFDAAAKVGVVRQLTNTLPPQALEKHTAFLLTLLHSLINKSSQSLPHIQQVVNDLRIPLRGVRDQDFRLDAFRCIATMIYGSADTTYQYQDLHALLEPLRQITVPGDSGASTTDLTIMIQNLMVNLISDLCIVNLIPGKLRFTFTSENATFLLKFVPFLLEMPRVTLEEDAKANVQRAVKVSKKLWKHATETVFATVAEKSSSDAVDSTFRVLLTFSALWTSVFPDEFSGILAEGLTCYDQASLKGDSSDQNNVTEEPGWLEVVIDLILSLMSKSFSWIRSPIQIVLHLLCPVLSITHFKVLIDATDPGNRDILEVDDVEEDVDSDVDLNDTVDEVNTEQDEATESEESTDGEEDEEPSDAEDQNDEANQGVVDAKLKGDIRKALGDAALDIDVASQTSGDNENDGGGDMGDDAMLALDASLAMVFKSHLNSRKNKLETLRQLAAFRHKVCELINVAIHSNLTVDVTVPLAVMLLKVSDQALKSSNNESLFDKTHKMLLTIIKNKHTGVNRMNEERAFAVFDQVFIVARQISNPMLRGSVAQLICWLIRLLKLISPENNMVKSKMERYLQEFMEHRSSVLPDVIFSEAFERFSELFFDFLPSLACYIQGIVPENATNERRSDPDQVLQPEIRIYCRSQACHFAQLLVKSTSKLIEDRRHHKSWSKFCKRMNRTVESIFGSLTLPHAEGTVSLENSATPATGVHSVEVGKPKFLAKFISLLRSMTQLPSSVALGPFQKVDWLASYMVPLTDQKLWSCAPLQSSVNEIRRVNVMKPTSLFNNILSAIKKRTVEEGDTAVPRRDVRRASESEGTVLVDEVNKGDVSPVAKKRKHEK